MVLATKRAVGSEYGYPIYQEPPVRKQKVRVRTQKRPKPMVGIAIISIFFMIGISYTFLQATKAQMIWQVNQTKEMSATMQMDNEKLKLEVAKLKSLDRIEVIAVDQLHMVKESGIEYLAFQEGLPGNQNSEVTDTANQDQKSTLLASSVPRNNLIEKIATAISKGTPNKG